MQDCYSEAAIRHYLDGVILHQSNRYDNAMCHYAFSAECAIKAFKTQFQQVYPVHSQATHDISPALKSMAEYHELLGVLDSRLSLMIGIGAPPPILFQEHPGRRYGNDVSYTDAELSACKVFTNKLVQQVIAAVIDGQLEYESERGAL